MVGNQLSPRHQARAMLLASIVVTLALYVVPQGHLIAYPLILLSTLVHELGHGVMAVLVGGSFERFVMWPDGSGAAMWSGRISRLDLALVAAGGLVGPAIAAGLGFAFGHTARGANKCLLAFGTAMVLALVFVVRNVFGFIFVAAVAALCFAVALKASREVTQLVLIFLAVQLALSVFSRGDYLFTRTAETAQGSMPSDVGQMAQALWLPFWFWGLVCAGISLAVLGYGLKTFWGR